MNWHDEKVVIEINDENDKKITDVELTKIQFVHANILASEEGISVEELILKSLAESIEKTCGENE